VTVAIALGFVASYLLGAVPTSYLVMRMARGVDLRTVGSGNLGATNLYRQLGWGYAIPVALFDVLKGTIPVLVIAPLAGATGALPLLMGAGAVLGHVYSVFVGFKGGKGVATAAGVVLGVAPWALLAAFGAWLLVLRLTGFVSLGSIIGAAIFPVVAWFAHPGQRSQIWLHVTLALLIVALHRANIRRLLDGTENRFGHRAGATPPEAA
jgi:glycerol-3-phosphate acyltransferase PlsY